MAKTKGGNFQGFLFFLIFLSAAIQKLERQQMKIIYEKSTKTKIK